MVPRVALLDHERQARLLPLARPGTGRRAAEQLAEHLRRQRIDLRPDEGVIILVEHKG